MKVGSLYRVDYGAGCGFGPPCMFLGFSNTRNANPEWAKMICQETGRRFESHIDYVYPICRTAWVYEKDSRS